MAIQEKHANQDNVNLLEVKDPEDNQKEADQQKQQMEGIIAEMNVREAELVAQSVQYEDRIGQLSSMVEQLQTSQKSNDEAKIEELNARIEELQAGINFAQKTFKEKVKMEKVSKLQQSQKEMKKLRQLVEQEKTVLHQEIQHINKKLDVAEQALSQKETKVVTLESHIETISHHFEERLKESNERIKEMTEWKSQAMQFGTMAESLSLMQQQIKELFANLEASNRRVIEVEENAHHDMTIMQDEKNEQSAALEEAKARIAMLEDKLESAEKEIELLGKECDQFDEDEKGYKETISELQAEIKQLKGVKTPPKAMGLIQQARLGVKPLSRESSRVERSVHPDDQAVERSAIDPSKRNRANCHQQ
ncbi:hypothetical protein B9Z55_010237 [Caenorhabditis nigoni]|uniref:Uncharacterized protein n=1 Tax=Caenorhabditis nigoni TaxID=1611254 RepID=A0A2G5UFW7_9PELO|nr:hypothetical protein B9Z55_010237 [Caenorhabditis nigoni]